MGRPLRAAQGGLVYHTLNRANARLTIFEDDGDFTVFERILADAVTRYAVRLLAYCVKPNHFHLRVNMPMTPAEGEAVQRSIRSGQPYGTERWQKRMAPRLGLESTLGPSLTRSRRSDDPRSRRSDES